MSENAPAEASKTIPQAEKLTLWVRAGARCEICNKYLLEDEFTAQPVNLGELAHNVGRKRSPGSPRGEAALAVDQRNDADNLLLLCGDHHRVIDAKVASGEYTVEQLTDIKKGHEDRIKFLTALGDDAETVVVRVVGGVRDAPVELSEATVGAAVRKNARYPRYGLSYRGADIEVDLRGLPGEGTDTYWEAGVQKIEEMLGQRVREGVERGDIRHLSVFALARIPFLASVGYTLDDKVPIDIYQKQRGREEGWGWDQDADPVRFEAVQLREGSTSELALLISLSGTINPDDLPRSVSDASLWTIRPVGVKPNRDILRSRVSLDRFNDSYHGFLSTVEQVFPEVRVVDLFAAAPVSAAIALGRGLMRDAQPALRMYDRDGDSYSAAMELNR